MYYYIVNGKRIYNTHLAHHESWLSHSPIQFVCNDEEYDKLDWTQEPAESMETLMDQEAVALRQRYERLVFFWSGGTDSHTMYNVFQRNNIHIDQIVTIGNEKLPYMPTTHWDWLQKNHWDSSTIITPYDKLNQSVRSRYLDGDEWMFNNVGDLKLFSNGPPDAHQSVDLCEHHHSGKNWIMVSGHEKPWIVYKDGRWYARQKDVAMRQTFGPVDRLFRFFCQPRLALKQAHMLKNVVKKTGVQLTNGLDAETVFTGNSYGTPNLGASGYRAFARACGRHDELSLGVSAMQKKTHADFVSIDIGTEGNLSDLNISKSETVLQELYSDRNATAINYINGLYNMFGSNREFFKHMFETGAMPAGQILKTKAIASKAYCIGA
jgi:hypothetical protein